MQRRNNVIKIIKSESGASMLFVLAAMLLLMAISISVLVAAGANASAGVNEHINHQLYMYADSTQKSIMYSLQTSSSDNGRDVTSLAGTFPTTLGGQVLGAAYNRSSSDPIEINIDPELSDGFDLSAVTVSIKFTPDVIITPAVGAKDEVKDPEGNIISPATERKPKTAAIKGSAVVTVTANYRDKSIITVATYDFTDGFLKDNGSDTTMLIDNAGKWRLISNEKIDK